MRRFAFADALASLISLPIQFTLASSSSSIPLTRLSEDLFVYVVALVDVRRKQLVSCAIKPS